MWQSGRRTERRAAERPVVDNMKEGYVSVLAPSQLGVGIPAGDSMLIHGVRLIAEKLGPRTVIVHTDLRNAYNEAWRRTIIQRHIDCSPLHHVIPALLASLSTDSYLVVDDRSAPLRSEDGVQQGAPLATTSFCVAIPKCSNVTARWRSQTGRRASTPTMGFWWAFRSTFGRLFTPSARPSRRPCVGLEVRFDKMHAYNAEMEAARREAPADIEWPAVPLGNTVPMDELRDLVPDAELSLPAFNVVTGSYDPRSLKSTLLEFKTMRGTVQQAAGAAAILFVRGNSRLP
eukprot:jgi/Tetstr1/432166/TSEL_021623.t1